MSPPPRLLDLPSVARRIEPLLGGTALVLASDVSLRTAPAWIAAVGLGAAAGSYWLWLEPVTDPSAASGAGGEARMDQLVLDLPPGRYLVDMRDATTGETLSRESAGGPPLVLGVPFHGVPVVAEIRPVGGPGRQKLSRARRNANGSRSS
jgi:hypothetical protein